MSGEMKRDGAAGTSRRSAGKIMLQLIGLIKPLLHIMLLAIVLGTAGYLCAIFLTILAGQTILRGLSDGALGMTLPAALSGDFFLSSFSIKGIFILLAVLRGVLHYVEQYCNHFIAFKLLAIIRHRFLLRFANFARRSLRDVIREI